MTNTLPRKQLYIGATMAVVATVIWAGNFIVARGVASQVPPIALAFYRWSVASLLLIPFSLRNVAEDWPVIKKNIRYFLYVALAGVTIFNTFIYIAGHYTSAINMALIGTTSSPVFVVLIAAIFLKQKIQPIRIVGVLFCIAGILVLLSKGSWQTLLSFRFGIGDVWVLAAALSFAIYNILVRYKPQGISALSFLTVTFATGSLILFPFFLYEQTYTAPIKWTDNLYLVIFYLAAGTSVIAFLLWNIAIARLGSIATALFGNLIPVVASIEAILWLGESLLATHIVSGVLVVIGLLLANSKRANSSINKPAA